MNGRSFLAVAVVLSAVASAFADHATRHLDALAADIADRRAAGPSRRQSRALARAAQALARDTWTEAADVAALSRTATAVARAFPGDETFASDVDAAVAAFVADLTEERRA